MTQFIRIKFDQWISTRLIDRIQGPFVPRGGPKPGAGRFYEVTLLDGSVVEAAGHLLDPERLQSITMPAILQLRALVWQDDAWNDATNEPYYDYLPIIAWRIDDLDYVTPVFIEKPAGNERWLIELPGGALCEPGTMTYPDFKAFLERLRERRQRAAAL